MMAEGGRMDAVVRAVSDYTRTHGRPPSIKEIADIVGLKSTSSVMIYLRRARDQGLLVNVETRSPRNWHRPAAAGCCPTCGRAQ